MILKVSKALKDLLAPTYGPNAGKVLVSNDYITQTYDDGLKIAREFTLEDKKEQAVLSFIKTALEETNKKAGDGTTRTVILMDAFLNSSLKNLKPYVAEAIEQIKKSAKPVKDKATLKRIAYNSFNNEEIAETVSTLVYELGKEGSISIEESNTNYVSSEKTVGFELERGYESSYFITDTVKMECVLDKPLILISDKKLESIDELLPILDSLEGRPIVIVGDVEGSILNTLIFNHIKGKLNSLVIRPQLVGERRMQVLGDLAAISGARVVTHSVSLEDLGTCDKVVAKDQSTLFIGGKSAEERIETIRNTTKDERRIAALSGGVGVIKVGANSEKERKALKEKIDDSVHATQEAFRNGIVDGADLPYYNVKTSSEEFNKALQAPRETLLENGASLLDKEAIDPCGVVIAALESAASIAGELLSVKEVIVK